MLMCLNLKWKSYTCQNLRWEKLKKSPTIGPPAGLKLSVYDDGTMI